MGKAQRCLCRELAVEFPGSKAVQVNLLYVSLSHPTDLPSLFVAVAVARPMCSKTLFPLYHVFEAQYAIPIQEQTGHVEILGAINAQRSSPPKETGFLGFSPLGPGQAFSAFLSGMGPIYP